MFSRDGCPLDSGMLLRGSFEGLHQKTDLDLDPDPEPNWLSLAPPMDAQDWILGIIVYFY